MARKEEVVKESAVTYGSGNVFADIGLSNPEDRLAKAELAAAIGQAIQDWGLTQQQAAERMGIDQPKVSKILRGRLSEFSTERLLTCLLHMGVDIDIVIHKTAAPEDRQGEIKVASI